MLQSFLNNIISFFPLLHNLGYLIIFLSAFLEATPLLGTAVPGHTLVIAGGFFARMGIFNVGIIMAFASVGAIAGDLVGYWVGAKYGFSFLSKYGKYFFFKQEYLERTKNLIKQHPGKTLIIGRFNAVARALAPFVAGMSEVPFFKFLFYNIVGGISWAVSSVLVGYIFGASYEVASKYIGRILFWGIVGGIIIGYGYYILNKRRHIFAKYHLYVVSLNIISLYLFAKMIEDVIDNESIAKFDIWLNQKMLLWHGPILDKIMIFITSIGNPLNLTLLCVLLFIILIWKKRWYYSLLVFLGTLGGLFFELAMKLIIHRPRPLDNLVPVSGYSFPSGHATMAAIFFGLLLYSFKGQIASKYLRRLFVLFNVILFLLVGFSRVYLSVHWSSDVIAGFSLGIFWLTFLVLLFRAINFLAENFVRKIIIKLNNLF